MQAINGFLEDGHFTPLEAIRLPRRIPVLMVFNEADVNESREARTRLDDDKAFWAKFDSMAVDSSDENDLLLDEAFTRRPTGRESVVFDNEGEE